MQWLILVLIFLLIYKFKFVDKIHIIIKTFFKRGFQKHDDYFGLYTYIRSTGRTERHFLLFAALLI